jgi:hypothetical protein
MTDLPTTYWSESEGCEVLISTLNYHRLVSTIGKVSRAIGGGTSPVLEALRAELAKRPQDTGPRQMAGQQTQDREARGAPVASPKAPLPRAAVIGDNQGSDDEEKAFRDRLDEDHANLASEAAALESAAFRLPKEVASDEDVEAISGWVIKAAALKRKTEDLRKKTKEPFLQRGRWVDSFFGSFITAVDARVGPLEKRKVPYLQAKRAREEAERQEKAQAARRAQDEANARAAEERRIADEAAERRRAAEEALRASANADAAEVERLEREAIQAGREEQLAIDAAGQAAKDVKATEKVAVREERILAGDHRHVLGRTAGAGSASALKTSYKPDVHNGARLTASLGPLAPFLGDAAIDAALAKAARAEPRPSIPGVDWIEETTSRTTAARS